MTIIDRDHSGEADTALGIEWGEHSLALASDARDGARLHLEFADGLVRVTIADHAGRRQGPSVDIDLVKGLTLANWLRRFGP